MRSCEIPSCRDTGERCIKFVLILIHDYTLHFHSIVVSIKSLEKKNA